MGQFNTSWWLFELLNKHVRNRKRSVLYVCLENLMTYKEKCDVHKTYVEIFFTNVVRNIFRSQNYLTNNVHDLRGNRCRFVWKAAIKTLHSTWKLKVLYTLFFRKNPNTTFKGNMLNCFSSCYTRPGKQMGRLSGLAMPYPRIHISVRRT